MGLNRILDGLIRRRRPQAPRGDQLISNPSDSPSLERLRELKTLADAADAAMYVAPRGQAKDFKDDALLYLSRATNIAEALGLDDEAAKLKWRAENLKGVWDHQFRSINW